MSALAYSTDRAGCVSHPTPTRRCTHVGLLFHSIMLLLRYGGDAVADIILHDTNYNYNMMRPHRRV